MKKRLFAIMLALAMLLAAVPALAEEGEATEVPETSTKIICKVCKKDVGSVDENGLCEKCVSNSKQDDTQQKMVTSFKTLNEDNAEGGTNGGSTGDNAGDSTGSSGNTGGETGNTGDNASGTTGGATGDNQETCEHTWTYKDAPDSDSQHYCRMHKKTCSKCEAEEWESHEWDRSKQEMVEESTCTKQGKDKLPCKLCPHVTYVLRELKPHTKDNGTVIKPATCTEKGTIQYTCTVCKAKLPEEEIPTLGHSYGSPSWSWCGFTSAKATFTCTRNCGHSETETASIVRNGINSCGYYTYTATVKFNGKTYTDTRTDYSCRPDWYYDPCYYNNPCGHWGCGSVCTRYSDCVPCRDYRTTFRVGGYNCLATPKTGDVSVIGMALISLVGAGAAIMGKKRK